MASSPSLCRRLLPSGWLDNTAPDLRPDRRVLPAAPARGDRPSPTATPPRRIKGLDPIQTGQLTREAIERGRGRPRATIWRCATPRVSVPAPERGKRKGPRYTPVSRRQDRPNAILWLLRNHPELKDAADHAAGRHHQSRFRDPATTHQGRWCCADDPVTLGLATQTDLDFEVNRANKEKPLPIDSGATLLPAAETTARKEAEVAAAAAQNQKPGGDLDVGAVFAKLKQLGGKQEKDEE